MWDQISFCRSRIRAEPVSAGFSHLAVLLGSAAANTDRADHFAINDQWNSSLEGQDIEFQERGCAFRQSVGEVFRRGFENDGGTRFLLRNFQTAYGRVIHAFQA